MSDEMTEDDCYDIAWFDEHGYIDLKSLAVVILCAAYALNQKEFESARRILCKGKRAAT